MIASIYTTGRHATYFVLNSKRKTESYDEKRISVGKQTCDDGELFQADALKTSRLTVHDRAWYLHRQMDLQR